MRYDVTACIVVFKNPRELLLDVIGSFLNTKLKVKLFLVDNSPTDVLRGVANDDRIEYLFNPSNPGFGAAHNIAIKASLGLSKYHLILNPDIYFEEGNLEKMFNFMECHPEVGHLMPKVLYPDGSIQYLCKTNPSLFHLFARRFMPSFLKKLFKRKMDNYELRNRDYGEMMFDIPYLSGCFMFIRTEIFEKVGFFDERIFMYIEDADLTRRILQVARTVYFPEAEIYHHFAKGSHKSWKLTWYSIHGAWVYFNKWGWLNNN